MYFILSSITNKTFSVEYCFEHPCKRFTRSITLCATLGNLVQRTMGSKYRWMLPMVSPLWRAEWQVASLNFPVVSFTRFLISKAETAFTTPKAKALCIAGNTGLSAVLCSEKLRRRNLTTEREKDLFCLRCECFPRESPNPYWGVFLCGKLYYSSPIQLNSYHSCFLRKAHSFHQVSVLKNYEN